jgi:DNA modification methylase
MKEALMLAIRNYNRWYKNCKNVRKHNGKICQVCPFKKEIIKVEKLEQKRKEQLYLDIGDQLGYLK